jgi:hypothetical protein
MTSNEIWLETYKYRNAYGDLCIQTNVHSTSIGSSEKYHHDRVVQELKQREEKLTEMICGLSANVQVLCNIIRDPNGENALAKMLILTTADHIVEFAEKLIET